MVIDSMQETMASNVINQPTNVVVELSTIVKINKYKGLHEVHHFILMAKKGMTHLGVIWIVSSRSVPVFFMIDV
jgi:hypothetical protein